MTLDGAMAMNTTPNVATAPPTPFGLIAGWGRFPIVVAEGLRERGHEIVGLGVKQHADPAIARLCTRFDWIGLGQLGYAGTFFVRHGVRRATLAGKIHKRLLLENWAALKHLPDWRTLRRFYPHFISTRKDRKDDTLLLAVVEEFASRGVTMTAATDLLPELLVKNGQLTRRGVSSREWKDIAFGWELAKRMGGLDVGQSVAVKGRAVLAVEAVEGTDAAIRRAGELCRGGGFSVVKVAKPAQDMRFDVPTIGVGTIETMAASGASVLAIEAEKTILVDQRDVVNLADRHGIAIVAVRADQITVENPPVAAGSSFEG